MDGERSGGVTRGDDQWDERQRKLEIADWKQE